VVVRKTGLETVLSIRVFAILKILFDVVGFKIGHHRHGVRGGRDEMDLPLLGRAMLTFALGFHSTGSWNENRNIIIDANNDSEKFQDINEPEAVPWSFLAYYLRNSTTEKWCVESLPL
jgi:hypothetical protein